MDDISKYYTTVISLHIDMSHFGATGTPVFDFLWRHLWVSKPKWILVYSLYGGKCNIHPVGSTSGDTRCQPLDSQHCGAVILYSNVATFQYYQVYKGINDGWLK